MNDRFRFRVWDKINEEWLNIPHLSLDVESGLLNDFFDYEEAAKRRYVLEQCTGLKDKNGKLIYEGDWLKTKDGYYCYVVWFDGFWWVKSLPSEAMDLEYSEFYKECEVIGNIHENTELLEVKND